VPSSSALRKGWAMPPTIDSTNYRSPNYDDRPSDEVVRALVLHSGEGTKESDLRELTTAGTKKSAHYYIDRAGAIYELVDPRYRAWHAGVSSYLGLTSWNDFAIGIESEHRQGQNWPVAQIDAFKALCQYLMARYRIPNRLIVAHRWIAPNRKYDPTDWPDEVLRPWIAALVPESGDPLRAATLPGPGGTTHACGVGFRAFYQLNGDTRLLGYALTDEQPAVGLDGRACTWLRTERVVLKYVEGIGVHLALLSEAKAKGWL
jgi:hypothetical protein